MSIVTRRDVMGARRRQWPLLTLAAAAVLASLVSPSTSATGVPPFERLVRLFDYDRRPPLGVRVHSERTEAGVRIQEISFLVRRLRLRALLLIPRSAGPHAGIVIAPEGVARRDAFLNDGRALARRGAVVLLVDGPWAARGLQGWPTCVNRDRPEVILSVIELRRSLDLLATRARADRSRLAVVGYSYSAWTAGVLAGVDRRPVAFALLSGEATMTRFVVETCGAKPGYRARMLAFNPVRYVGRAAPAALLMQNGRHDQFWPRREMVALHRAGSRPKTIRWYDAAHDLNEDAQRDRIEWLSQHLRLSAAKAMRP